MDTLSGIGVDMIYGDIIANAQPLDLLLNTSNFEVLRGGWKKKKKKVVPVNLCSTSKLLVFSHGN